MVAGNDAIGDCYGVVAENASAIGGLLLAGNHIARDSRSGERQDSTLPRHNTTTPGCTLSCDGVVGDHTAVDGSRTGGYYFAGGISCVYYGYPSASRHHIILLSRESIACHRIIGDMAVGETHRTAKAHDPTTITSLLSSLYTVIVNRTVDQCEMVLSTVDSASFVVHGATHHFISSNDTVDQRDLTTRTDTTSQGVFVV